MTDTTETPDPSVDSSDVTPSEAGSSDSPEVMHEDPQGDGTQPEPSSGASEGTNEDDASQTDEAPAEETEEFTEDADTTEPEGAFYAQI